MATLEVVQNWAAWPKGAPDNPFAIWFDRIRVRAEVGGRAADDIESEHNWPAETVRDRLYEAWRTK